jgi:hypothetical protein
MISVVFLMLLASAPWIPPAGVTCQTYEEKSLNRQQTICSDGTRGMSTYNPTLQRWQTTITPPPGIRPEPRQAPGGSKNTK